MNTLHFRYAVEIEKTHSITQAAENLYMAQPNLSKSIKELENSLGITIFRRTSKGVIPTEQGLKFLEYAKQVLIQIDKMEAIHAPGKAQSRKLKVSAPRSGYISRAFTQYIADMDVSNEMELCFCETNSISTIENVREHGYDFGIIRFNLLHEKYFSDFLAEKNLTANALWEFAMTAVMSSDHPAVKREDLTYGELSDEFTELCYADDSVPYVSGAIERLMAGNRPADRPTKKIYIYDRGTALAFLSENNAFILDSPLSPEISEEHGLIQRKCGFRDNHYKDMIIYAEGHKFTEKEICLINKVHEIKNAAEFAGIR